MAVDHRIGLRPSQFLRRLAVLHLLGEDARPPLRQVFDQPGPILSRRSGAPSSPAQRRPATPAQHRELRRRPSIYETICSSLPPGHAGSCLRQGQKWRPHAYRLATDRRDDRCLDERPASFRKSRTKGRSAFFVA
jgi:hypothetical protein